MGLDNFQFVLFLWKISSIQEVQTFIYYPYFYQEKRNNYKWQMKTSRKKICQQFREKINFVMFFQHSNFLQSLNFFYSILGQFTNYVINRRGRRFVVIENVDSYKQRKEAVWKMLTYAGKGRVGVRKMFTITERGEMRGGGD